MQLRKNWFLLLYTILVLTDIACGFETLSSFRMFSKPLILISLIGYFAVKAGNNRNTIFYLMLGALFCSLLGDIFLMFEKVSSLYFTLGLASFLIAHVLFALTFIKRWNKLTLNSFKWVSLALLSYGILLFFILKNSLGPLRIPVILYVLGIMAMAITAFRRKGMVSQLSFILVFVGALLFVVSDSLLAVDKFMFVIPIAHILVMGTYATAQYLITKGVLLQGDFGN